MSQFDFMLGLEKTSISSLGEDMKNNPDRVPLAGYRETPLDQMVKQSSDFYELMRRRRTVREISSRPVPREVIESCVLAAGSAPSGANMQPWQFVVVSDPDIKSKIREKAEKVEADFYNRRAPDYWLKALEHLETDEHKPFLENAPYLIVIFTVRHTVMSDGSIEKHYYISESVGIATGILITAVHTAGLVCLTHTPSPMQFLRDILKRPRTETPFLVLAVGYPEEKVTVPDISKKSLNEIATFI